MAKSIFQGLFAYKPKKFWSFLSMCLVLIWVSVFLVVMGLNYLFQRNITYFKFLYLFQYLMPNLLAAIFIHVGVIKVS